MQKIVQQGEKTRNEVLIGALAILLTDWSQTENRIGRRRQFHTTGATQVRLRTLDERTREDLYQVAMVLGIPVGQEDIEMIFSGNEDYQMSFSINRFEMVGGGLSSTDKRAIERVKGLLDDEKFSHKVLDTLKRAA